MHAPKPLGDCPSPLGGPSHDEGGDDWAERVVIGSMRRRSTIHSYDPGASRWIVVWTDRGVTSSARWGYRAAAEIGSAGSDDGFLQHVEAILAPEHFALE
jgi:hypothetical protein